MFLPIYGTCRASLLRSLSGRNTYLPTAHLSPNAKGLTEVKPLLTRVGSGCRLAAGFGRQPECKQQREQVKTGVYPET